jgi:hypothetical protein
MSCRRVLSSTPLLVRGSETGGDSVEKKLTNKNYKYYNGKMIQLPLFATNRVFIVKHTTLHVSAIQPSSGVSYI